MRQFFKMMFASALGVFLAAGLLVFIAFSMFVGLLAGMGNTSAYRPANNTVLKIVLDGSMADNPTENPLSLLMGDVENVVSLRDVLDAVEIAGQDDRIAGIYLESGVLSCGTASLEAIRRSLLDFKKSTGKFIVAYADTYSQGNYFLCSVADKVFLNPQGTLELVGIASQTMFYKGLLDKIGVDMQIFKVGTYKGAVEPFMQDKLSEANREQIQSYISSIWNRIAEGIAESRGVSVETVNRFANDGLSLADPMEAVDLGFVDALNYKMEVEDYVKSLAGQSTRNLVSASVSEVKTLRVPSLNAAPTIAVLYAEGEIEEQASSSLYDMEACISEKLVDELIKLKDDDNIYAVVLRVNSPGGSSYVSDQIWRAVVELRKQKPVVVSMGDVAASGGYYISCAANRIIAEANTLTGSIGVFGIFPDVSGLFGKLDLTTDILKTNTFADIGDFSRPMNDSEKRLVQRYVDRVYQTFLARCAEGRGMTTEQIDAIGQGRVWTGEQAKEIGLVDELGGIEEAIRVAAELAAIDQYSVTTIKGSKSFLDEFLEIQWSNIKVAILRDFLGDEFERVKAIGRVRTSQGIQARLPFDMRPL